MLFRSALHIGDSPKPSISAAFWRILHHELTLAETIFRRLLVLIAMTMNVSHTPKRAAQSTQSKRTKPSEGRTPSSRTPLFSLFDRLDPLPREAAPAASVVPGPQPRFWVPSMEQMYPPQPARKTIKTLRDTAALLRRLSALQAAMVNPGPHAARMAHWIIQRQLSAQAVGYAPQPDIPRDRPICYGRPPGVTKKRLGDMIHTVRRLSFDAHVALSAGFDTS